MGSDPGIVQPGLLQAVVIGTGPVHREKSQPNLIQKYQSLAGSALCHFSNSDPVSISFRWPRKLGQMNLDSLIDISDSGNRENPRGNSWAANEPGISDHCQLHPFRMFAKTINQISRQDRFQPFSLLWCNFTLMQSGAELNDIKAVVKDSPTDL